MKLKTHSLNIRNKIRYLSLVALIIFGFHPAINSQTISVRVNSGIDFFNTPELKKFQDYLSNTWGGAKTVQSFPPYYNFQAQVTYSFSSDLTAGLYTDYTSTAGRVDYTDYSGEFRYDETVSRISIGGLVEHQIYSFDNFAVGGSAKLSYQISKLKLDNLLNIYGDSQNTSFSYYSHGLGIEPGIYFGYTYSYVIVRLEASYQFTFSGVYSSDSYKLENLSGNLKEVSPEWNSFKLGITLGIIL